jgi:uncharacterized protein YpbB
VSLGLYLQGKKPEEIAQERELTVGTILGHLARYLDSGEVSLNALVAPEHQQNIMAVIHKIGTADGTTAIKNLCQPDVTYDEIRLMMDRMRTK